jgi:hypothetical protein
MVRVGGSSPPMSTLFCELYKHLLKRCLCQVYNIVMLKDGAQK